MMDLMITACFLGFVYSAAPGAVNTEALRRGLKRGFIPAFSVQIGALLGDLVWAAVGLTSVALFFHFLTIQIILGIVGVTFLLRMAWMSFLDARKPIDLTNPESTEGQRDFFTGIVFSIANPFGIAFWGGIGGGFAAQIAGMPLIDKLVFLFVGFSVGAFVWCVGISALIAKSRKFIGEKILSGIFTLSSLAMVYFALEMLWNLIHSTIYPMFSTRTQFKISDYNERGNYHVYRLICLSSHSNE